MDPDGRVRHDHDRTGRPGPGNPDRHDRRDPCEGASNRIEPGGSKRGRGRLIGRTRGGLNSKLHVLADAKGRPIQMFLSAGQTSDCIGARALLSSIPSAGALLADRGHDADWFRNALIERGISPCIPSRTGRKAPIPHDASIYRLRHRIENMFAHLNQQPVRPHSAATGGPTPAPPRAQRSRSSATGPAGRQRRDRSSSGRSRGSSVRPGRARPRPIRR
ncbi:transposase [Paracoccus yeei]